MSDNEAQPVSRKEFVQVLHGVRFACAVVLLVLSYLNLKAALSLGVFNQIYNDMLNGRPLPAMTFFVLNHSATILLFSLLIPAGALACLLIRRGMALSFYALGILTLLSLSQLVVVTTSMTSPLLEVIRGMQEGPSEPGR